MKIEVRNKNYNEKIGVLDFENGVAEVAAKDEKEAVELANRLGFTIVEDEKKPEPKKEAPKKTTSRKSTAKKSKSKE